MRIFRLWFSPLFCNLRVSLSFFSMHREEVGIKLLFARFMILILFIFLELTASCTKLRECLQTVWYTNIIIQFIDVCWLVFDCESGILCQLFVQLIWGMRVGSVLPSKPHLVFSSKWVSETRWLQCRWCCCLSSWSVICVSETHPLLSLMTCLLSLTVFDVDLLLTAVFLRRWISFSLFFAERMATESKRGNETKSNRSLSCEKEQPNCL